MRKLRHKLVLLGLILGILPRWILASEEQMPITQKTKLPPIEEFIRGTNLPSAEGIRSTFEKWLVKTIKPTKILGSKFSFSIKDQKFQNLSGELSPIDDTSTCTIDRWRICDRTLPEDISLARDCLACTKIEPGEKREIFSTTWEEGNYQITVNSLEKNPPSTLSKVCIQQKGNKGARAFKYDSTGEKLHFVFFGRKLIFLDLVIKAYRFFREISLKTDNNDVKACLSVACRLFEENINFAFSSFLPDGKEKQVTIMLKCDVGQGWFSLGKMSARWETKKATKFWDLYLDEKGTIKELCLNISDGHLGCIKLLPYQTDKLSCILTSTDGTVSSWVIENRSDGKPVYFEIDWSIRDED